MERVVAKMREAPWVSGIVVAMPQDGSFPAKANLAALRDADPPVIMVDGGDTRQDSVYNALQAVPREAVWIAVHDAVRPYFSLRTFHSVLEAAFERGAAICGVPPSDTIKITDKGGTDDFPSVVRTLDRNSLVAVQTPQVFAAGLYRRAHETARRDGFVGTDDSSLVERLGVKVAVVPGERTNTKITYPEDLVRYGERVTGLGYDVHPLVTGRKCVIGGVEIPSDKGLMGHSDADVLVHSVMDALLGALGKGDIGQHFPDSDPQYKGASSIDLLSRLWAELKEVSSVVNVDSVVIAESPRIMPHAAKIRENIAGALECPPQRISVKATTAEGLGAIGRGEGIAAYCVATLVTHI